MTEETIFSDALEKPDPQERSAYLAQACGGDGKLRQRVELLLSAYDAGDFLEVPAQDVVITLDRATPEKPGAEIGPYKLLEQIGEGGMGIVYMAQQTRPVKRRVALKVIKPGMDSRQVIARFEAERQALALMDHPNIARILDAGVIGETGIGDRESGIGKTDGLGGEAPRSPLTTDHRPPTSFSRPFFVMELVRGLPITDYCDREKLDISSRLALFTDVCRAVQHAHLKGIIHRDIKPSNVLVTLHDGVSVVKVIDFGVAKALNQELTERTLFTQFSQMIGTPLYMSPEQAAMSGLDIDTRTDVYSLGVLLYELLTGATPFDCDTLKQAGLDEMRRIIRDDEPPRPSTRISTLKAEGLTTASQQRGIDQRRLRQLLQGELDWIVMKALEKDRNRRYESASAFAADVQRYLTDEPVQACPPSAAYRFRKFANKHRAPFTTAVLLAASLLLGTIVSLWQAIRATAAEAQATANEAKAKTEEQKALAAAAGEAAQRKQAERNFEAALEAVDRMLANVSDPELNDVRRVGPLRRKMLSDAMNFCQRIPLEAGVAADLRVRMARMWQDVGRLAVESNHYEAAGNSFKTGVDLLSQVVEEQPRHRRYRSALASLTQQAGFYYFHVAHDFVTAEKVFRRSSELYGELITDEPQIAMHVVSQSHSLKGLGMSLGALNKLDEAIGAVARAADLFDRCELATAADRGGTIKELADLHLQAGTGKSDDLYRRAIDTYRRYFVEGGKHEHNQAEFATILQHVAYRFSSRHPDEAESLWHESEKRWQALNAANPRVRNSSHLHVNALLAHAKHLRQRATVSTSDDIVQTASRLSRANELFREALALQRNTTIRFGLQEDRFLLCNLLAEEAERLLKSPAHAGAARVNDKVAQNLEPDALLTEAIQLCRVLAAEFPANPAYKPRLEELLKLQAEHVGQKTGSEQPKVEITPPLKLDGC